MIASFVIVVMHCGSSRADVKLPAMFTDHAVLQREMPVPVWGSAEPGEEVHVAIAGQTHKTKADDKGNWSVTLKPLKVGEPLKLVVEGQESAGSERYSCGRSVVVLGAIEHGMAGVRFDERRLGSVRRPIIRRFAWSRVKEPGSQTPVEDFEGEWEVCSPESVGGFSAVGYFFGRELHDQLGVPIGLDRRFMGRFGVRGVDSPRSDGRQPAVRRSGQEVGRHGQGFDDAKWKAGLAEWRKKAAEARKAGKPAPPRPTAANDPGSGNHRPANLYHGRLEPVMPYAIRGAIWYQGESNAGRAYQYRDMFPLMIKSWREDWKQGDFPFYWVQLADFMAEKPEPGDSSWAELREAQTMTQDKLPNTGEAVIIDIGEAADIHPKKKLEVGRRLARLALGAGLRQEGCVPKPAVRVDGEARATRSS